MKDYIVLTAYDDFGLVYKIYSSDFTAFYGNYYSPMEVYHKLSALRNLDRCCV